MGVAHCILVPFRSSIPRFWVIFSVMTATSFKILSARCGSLAVLGLFIRSGTLHGVGFLTSTGTLLLPGFLGDNGSLI